MKRNIRLMLLAYVPSCLIMISALAGCGTSLKTAVSDKSNITVTCPEARLYLPDFPPFSDKEAFYNDSLLFSRGVAARETERGKQAVIDARNDLDFYLQRFGSAMGVSLSETGTPAIAKYIRTTYEFARSGVTTAKSSFSRQRPYSYFKVHSAIPEEEGPLGEYSSYPSGHALRAWAIAMALVAIDDDAHYSEIIKVGLEIGESRIIAGFHYASDVEYARISASVAFAKLASDPEYVKLLNQARKELDSIRRN